MKKPCFGNHRLILLLFCQVLAALLLPPVCAAQESEDDSAETKHTVKDFLESNLPTAIGRKIVLDEITGLLTITDTPSNHRIITDLINEWDRGPKQVDIEAKFIEITFTDIDEFGMEWQLSRDDAGESKPYIGGVSGVSNHTGTVPVDTGTSFMGARSAWDAVQTAGMGFFLGKATIGATELASYLRALQQSGKANLLNAPRVTTIDGQMANFQVVRTIPYATATKRTTVTYKEEGEEEELETVLETYTIEEERIGVVLEVTPTIIEGTDLIQLEIHPEVTKLSSQVAITQTTPPDLGWPIIDARTAQTSIIIKSGQTVLIGGLIQDQDSGTVKRKIPLLGDIPLIGNAFKYNYENREKKNLVILVTTRLIDSQGEEVR